MSSAKDFIIENQLSGTFSYSPDIGTLSSVDSSGRVRRDLQEWIVQRESDRVTLVGKYSWTGRRLHYARTQKTVTEDSGNQFLRIRDYHMGSYSWDYGYMYTMKGVVPSLRYLDFCYIQAWIYVGEEVLEFGLGKKDFNTYKPFCVVFSNSDNKYYVDSGSNSVHSTHFTVDWFNTGIFKSVGEEIDFRVYKSDSNQYFCTIEGNYLCRFTVSGIFKTFDCGFEQAHKWTSWTAPCPIRTIYMSYNIDNYGSRYKSSLEFCSYNSQAGWEDEQDDAN
ncbi:TPA_asm: P7 [Peat soil associated betacytorhabdovirus 2]|jgi:hypothetical protein|nr:TPA_asm: P7 [Peat soil associated betacytorhabdovirus 2]